MEFEVSFSWVVVFFVDSTSCYAISLEVTLLYAEGANTMVLAQRIPLRKSRLFAP